MNRKWLVVMALGVAATSFACTGASEDARQLPGPSVSALTINEPSENWRVIIVRANGAIETRLSLDRPIVCGEEPEPKVVFLCGTARVEGEPLPIAWDFLPVYVGAGDTYTIEPPSRSMDSPTPMPEGQTPTSTPIGP